MNAYQEFKVIGSRPIRPDGLDKVTGRARYGADLNMQGQLYGHVVRSPHAHAVIKSIDCSKALAMEGVLSVMTGEDLVEPGNQMLGSGEGALALRDVSPMVMSRGRVLFHSQAVAERGSGVQWIWAAPLGGRCAVSSNSNCEHVRFGCRDCVRRRRDAPETGGAGDALHRQTVQKAKEKFVY